MILQEATTEESVLELFVIMNVDIEHNIMADSYPCFVKDADPSLDMILISGIIEGELPRRYRFKSAKSASAVIIQKTDI